MPSEAELAKLIRGYNGAETYVKLAELAAPHVERSPLFEPLAYDPASPLHDLATVTLEPKPSAGVDEVRALLSLAYPDWERVILPALASRPDLVNELVNRIKYDHIPFSILLAHERIEDVAFVMAVLTIVLSEHIPYHELVQRFHLVISSIIRCIGAFGMPAPEVLRLLGWVHFSFPRTESVRKGGFESELVDAANRLVRQEIARSQLAVKFLAGPGSIDRVLNLPARMMKFFPGEWAGRHHTVHIQPVRPGTAKLLAGYVLPVAAVFSGEQQFCRIGKLGQVDSLEDVHLLMEWIAKVRYSETLTPTFYHREAATLARFARVVGLR